MFRSLYNEVTNPPVQQQQPLPLSFNIYNDMKLQMQQQQVNAILPNVSPVSVPVDKHDNTNTMQPINPVVDAVSGSSGSVSVGSSGLYSDNRLYNIEQPHQNILLNTVPSGAAARSGWEYITNAGQSIINRFGSGNGSGIGAANITLPPSIASSNRLSLPVDSNDYVPDVSNSQTNQSIFSRDCALRPVLDVTCPTAGVIAASLLPGGEAMNNNASNAQQTKALRVYQNRSQDPLHLEILRQGASATVDALKKQARKMFETNDKMPSARGLAATDLYSRSGVLETFDFCSELKDTSVPPFSTECVQRLFRQMGGKSAGKMYPRSATMPYYNGLMNWKAVNTFIKKMATDTQSSNYKVQQKGVADFLGISVEGFSQQMHNRIPKTNGMEVLWWDFANRIFLGRQIVIDYPVIHGEDTLPPAAFRATPGSTGGVYSPIYGFYTFSDSYYVPAASAASSVDVSNCSAGDVGSSSEFCKQLLDKVDVAFMAKTSGSFRLLLNRKQPDRKVSTAGYGNTNNSFEVSAEQKSGVSNCFQLSNHKPNIFSSCFVYENQEGTGASLQLGFRVCDGGRGKYLPLSRDFFYMSQEVRAPVLHFVPTAKNNMDDVRMPGVFSVVSTGAASKVHADNKLDSPGGQSGYLQLNAGAIVMRGLLFGAFQSVCMCFRVRVKPTKMNLFSLKVSDILLTVRMLYGGEDGVNIVVSMYDSKKGTVTQEYMNSVVVGGWYMLCMQHGGDGHSIGMKVGWYPIAGLGLTGGSGAGNLFGLSQNSFTGGAVGNGVVDALKERAEILIGQQGAAGSIDIAWIDFFDYAMNTNDIMREALQNWGVSGVGE
jgi:hypothetical protein